MQKPPRIIRVAPASDVVSPRAEKAWTMLLAAPASQNVQEVPVSQVSERLRDPQVKRLLPADVISRLQRLASSSPHEHLSRRHLDALIADSGPTPAERPAPRSTRLVQAVATGAAHSVLPASQRAASYLQQYNCRPPPFLLPLLSVAQVAVFCVSSADGLHYGIDTRSPLVYSPFRRRELWRLLSYALVHADWLHLTANMILQLAVGVPLELVHKWWRVAVLYTTGVICGALATAALDPRVFLAGASGGAYCLVAAHAANLLLNWADMELALVRLALLLLLATADVGSAIYQRHSGDDARHTLAYSAHLAGAAVGVLLGNVVLRNIRRQRWERVLWWTSVVGMVILVSVMVVFNLAAPQGYFPDQIY